MLMLNPRVNTVCHFAISLCAVIALTQLQPLIAQDNAGKEKAASAGASQDAAAEPARGGRLVNVQRIWNKSKHNAFTDLIRFDDQWYCVFREASEHVRHLAAPIYRMELAGLGDPRGWAADDPAARR